MHVSGLSDMGVLMFLAMLRRWAVGKYLFV